MQLRRVRQRRVTPVSQWQPDDPVHEHPPAEQSEKEHVAPCPHARTHPPLGHETVQVAPAGHEVLQWPEEQSTVHAPSPQ